MTVLFISDLHLSPSRPETTALFLEFIETTACRAQALYILGDLFDYWAGDDDRSSPFHRRICAALAGLPNGCCHFLPGNRDFLIGAGFAAASGVNLITEPFLCHVGGVATLLLHGDTLCTDDTDYQAFRAKVRSPAWREGFLGQTLAERRVQIEALRERSEYAKQHKTAPLMDVNNKAVISAFQNFDIRRMIHGHTHRPGHHPYQIDGKQCERWVLGEWHTEINALAVDDDGCRWLNSI